MKPRTVSGEMRSGVRWVVFGVCFLLLMFGAWWLVEETNREGQHNAELLPIFAVIPLSIGMFHIFRARRRDHRVQPG